MQASRLEDGKKGFAFGILQAYFIVLVICGVLALLFTGWFLWNNKHELPSLIKIIRYRAAEDDADVDLEKGKNDQWEMATAHSNKDDPAGSDHSDTTTEDEYDPHNDGDYLCNDDHDWSNRCGNKRHDEDDWPAYVEILDNEGKGDNEPEEDDPAGCGYDDTESKNEDESGRWCPFCKDYKATGWTCSCDRGKCSWFNPIEGKDENPRPRYTNEGEDNEGKGDNEPEEDDQAGPGYSENETEDEDDSDRWCPICKDYNAPGWTCSCDLRYYSWSNPYEGKGENQDNCPESNNDSDVPHLTPSSSGSDAEVNTTTPDPPTFNNWYAPADDTESCSSCDSEYTKTIPWTRPAAHREPLTPTSPSGYVAGVEDNDDGEESDVSDGATIGEPEGGYTETCNDRDSSISYGSTPGQGFQSEQEDTGPVNNVLEPKDHTTSAQEQRPQPTGTAFSPSDLLAGHADILADETGHVQRPPVGKFRHGIAKPLRLTIPTQGITNAEPRAPTTPANSHSLAQWPGMAYSGNSWRDV